MSSPSSRRQKIRDKKRAKREQEKRARKVRQRESRSEAGLVRRAARWPIRECRISSHFRDTGLAQVFVAREGPGEVGAAVFLVDLCCRGVKDCMLYPALVPARYEDLVLELEGAEPGEACAPELAAKVLATGAAYGERLGFRQAAAYAQGRELLAGVGPEACAEEIPLGRRGLPLYLAEPGDDVGAILARLEQRVGPEGFRFLLPEEGVGDVRGLEDDPRAGPAGGDADPAQAMLERLRRAEEHVTCSVLRHALIRRGLAFLEDALWEFGEPVFVPRDDDDDEEDDDDDPLAGPAFLPWALFAWRTDPPGEGSGAPGPPLALEFLEQHPERLSDLERRLLEEACRRPFSFHAVTAVDPGTSMTLRDLMTGRETVVLERATVEPGHVLYARVVTLDGVSIQLGMEPMALPPAYQKGLTTLREIVRGEGGLFDEEQLHGMDGLLRQTYRDMAKHALEGEVPMLGSSDGEPPA